MLTQYKPVHTTSHSLKMVSNTTSLQMVNLGLGTTLTLVGDTVATTQAAPNANQLTTHHTKNEASTQSVSSNQQSSNTNVEAVSAPKLLHTHFNFIIFIAFNWWFS